MNQLLKSVVRENRTLRSVGAGGGPPPPATRWCQTTGIPTVTCFSPLGEARWGFDFSHEWRATNLLAFSNNNRALCVRRSGE